MRASGPLVFNVFLRNQWGGGGDNLPIWKIMSLLTANKCFLGCSKLSQNCELIFQFLAILEIFGFGTEASCTCICQNYQGRILVEIKLCILLLCS